MLKKLGFSFATSLLFITVTTVAQQDPQWTQNMFNKFGVNPAVAGSNGIGTICGTGLFRQQNMGFSGNPQTMMLSAHGGFRIATIQGGTGINVYQDQLGAEKTTSARLALAYHRGLWGGDIGIGIEGGIMNKTIVADWIAIDPYYQDPSIPDVNTGKTSFDMNFGIFFKREDLYVGLSSLHLLPPKFNVSGSPSSSLPGAVAWTQKYNVTRHFYVMAGYNYQLGNPDFEIRPMIFAKTDPASPQLDINVNMWYKKQLWGGLSYRLQDAIALLVGTDLGIAAKSLENLKIGVAYDLTMSQLKRYSSGSVEIMLTYCHKLYKEPKLQRYKSVRFL